MVAHILRTTCQGTIVKGLLVFRRKSLRKVEHDDVNLLLAVSNKVQLTGLDKPTVEEFGVYKRYSYKVTTPADFSDLQAFIAAYATSPLRIGVQNVEMKQAKRDLFSTTRFEMFVIK